jgi:nitroimidazol reductase NimA-like FMN-containing flavoprotein (pyridoxamine 5'-phosphate oxidase superfamily)
MAEWFDELDVRLWLPPGEEGEEEARFIRLKAREMRRKDRELNRSDAIKLLIESEYGILSTTDKSGQPYGVPLNYVYKDNCIYLHSAFEGHKIENMQNNPKVSFCAIAKARVIPSRFSTEYESVVVFGNASEVVGTERYGALLLLLEKYSPEFMEEGRSYIEKHVEAAKVIKISISHISGKASPAKSKV